MSTLKRESQEHFFSLTLLHTERPKYNFGLSECKRVMFRPLFDSSSWKKKEFNKVVSLYKKNGGKKWRCTRGPKLKLGFDI